MKGNTNDFNNLNKSQKFLKFYYSRNPGGRIDAGDARYFITFYLVLTYINHYPISHSDTSSAYIQMVDLLDLDLAQTFAKLISFLTVVHHKMDV